MTNRRKQPKIYHTSPSTVDKDQAEALRAAKKIFGSLTAPATTPKPVTRKNKKK